MFESLNTSRTCFKDVNKMTVHLKIFLAASILTGCSVCVLHAESVEELYAKGKAEQKLINITIDKVAEDFRGISSIPSLSGFRETYLRMAPKGQALPLLLRKHEESSETVDQLPVSVFSDPVYERNALAMVRGGSSGRVYGDGAVPTRKSEFPECVAIGRSGDYNASGIILEGGIILTAAHICADDPELVPDVAWIGRVTSNCLVAPKSGIFVRLSEFKRHSGYKFDSEVGNPLGNDVMLLRIHPDDRSKVTTHSLIASISDVESLGSEPHSSVRAVGYGHSRLNDRNELEGFGVRRHISLGVGDRNNSDYGLFTETDGDKVIIKEFVTGSKIAGGDTCKGDSGGPLYIVGGEGDGDFLLIGITSRATPGALRICGDGSICTAVPYYSTWIKEATSSSDGWRIIE